MGKIAKKYCRKIFVTDDNPRNEDPKKIRRAIIKGCKKHAIEMLLKLYRNPIQIL